MPDCLFSNLLFCQPAIFINLLFFSLSHFFKLPFSQLAILSTAISPTTQEDPIYHSEPYLTKTYLLLLTNLTHIPWITRLLACHKEHFLQLDKTSSWQNDLASKKTTFECGGRTFFASFVAKKYLSNVNKNKFEIFF